MRRSWRSSRTKDAMAASRTSVVGKREKRSKSHSTSLGVAGAVRESRPKSSLRAAESDSDTMAEWSSVTVFPVCAAAGIAPAKKTPSKARRRTRPRAAFKELSR